ncbi:restriction endonuclease subunit S [Motiliproteus sp. SC1-56]|uniref:restriction endonuclease subunit S n=1 Tax=Motiliproteus sp. SC1-56 TaxID=2799565 RepID=UPI001A8D0BF1|nr:restriction endonuclease subunit S [Motiliproteus sp. SC1-56]
MTGKYQIYCECKDSGVEWLGKIPEGWQTLRLGALLQERGETNQGPVTENILSVLKDVGVIPYAEKGDIGNKKSDDIERYKVVHPGDLVVNSMNVIIGSVGISKYLGALSPVYLVLHPRDGKVLQHPYLGYIFQIKTFQQWLKRLGYGILDHRLRIPMDNLKKEFLPLPPVEEQRTIAAFLDQETARIDTLIAKQRRLIELLKEKRQAVISHAVTKGLNPDAPMKDSGVEWLGEVPAHWHTTRLKYECLSIVDCLHSTPAYDQSGDFPAIRTADISPGKLDVEGARRVTEDVFQERNIRLKPETGDIIYSREGERYGMAACVPAGVDICLGQRVMLFRAAQTPEFVMWALNSESCYKQAQQDVIGSTSPHVNVETIKNFALAWPPHGEREEITAHITDITQRLDRLMSIAASKAELLHERRTALISAAVTGKIDVRNWKPNSAEQEADRPMVAEPLPEYPTSQEPA